MEQKSPTIVNILKRNVSDGSDSTIFVSKSNYFRRQVENGEYNTFMSANCIFHFVICVAFVTIVCINGMLNFLLKCNGVYFGKLNIH